MYVPNDSDKRAADQAARTAAEPEFVEATVVEDQGDVVADDELAVALGEAADLRDRYARLQAEWDNFRKRTASERIEERTRASQSLVEDLLPVIDDMERALDHAGTVPEVVLFADGVSAILGKFLEVLARHGVSVIDPCGEPFDLNVHQAVAHVEDPSVPDETCVMTLQKGYEMGGRVVRPATVSVSTGGPVRPKE